MDDKLFDDLVNGRISEEDYNFAKNASFIEVGARVVVTDSELMPHEDMKNKKGTIKWTKRNNDQQIIATSSILVEFDEDIGGHDGHVKGGFLAKNGHGWYVPAKYLKLVGDHDE